MHTLLKKSFVCSLLLIVAIILPCVGFLINDTFIEKDAVSAPLVISTMADIEVTVPNAGEFGDTGIFIKRPDEINSENEYWGSVFVPAGRSTFKEIRTRIMVDGWWYPNDSSTTGFVGVASADMASANWYLREDAAPGVYGIECVYEDGITIIYRVVYTDEWTYVSMTDANGNMEIENFRGVEQKLELTIGYNAGSTVSGLEVVEGLTGGVEAGAIESGEIINIIDVIEGEGLRLSIRSLSGEEYPGEIYAAPSYSNKIIIDFDGVRLGDDVYVIELKSQDNGNVYGQFIIDNTGSRPINLSTLWVFFVIAGSIIMLFGVGAFISPIMLRKINENRIYAENVKIAKMKNPEAYADDKESFFKRFKEKLKTPVKKEETKEEDKPVVEDEVKEGRFTSMLREKREKRKFMNDNHLTSEMVEDLKKKADELEAAKTSSFAFLRDDDEPIATLQKEEEEVRTIETGSYVEDGVTFSKLDSLVGEDDDENQNS